MSLSVDAEKALETLAAASGRDFELCKRCRCCEVETEPCDQCDGYGVFGHDCGEDCCHCLYPEDNETCDMCRGRGYVRHCIGGCDEDGQHERRSVPAGVPATTGGED